jgi:hypothetical protein
VFYIALPALVVRGLGIIVDFYSDAFLWNYIAGFLILRGLALVFSVTWVVGSAWHAGHGAGIGAVAVNWLALTWISTVILGVPVSQAVFGSPDLGIFFGLVSCKE